MAYVSVPKDLSKIKTKLAFNLTTVSYTHLPAKPLHILAVTFRLSTAATLGLHGNGGLL